MLSAEVLIVKYEYQMNGLTQIKVIPVCFFAKHKWDENATRFSK